MSFPRGSREAVLAVVAAGVVLLVALGIGQGALRGLETSSLDLRFRVRGERTPGAAVAVILVDDRSLAAFGRWPWSRHVFAKAVAGIDRAGAKVIVFDFLFTEPEEPVPAGLARAARAAVAALSPARDADLRAALQRLGGDDPDGDLAAAMAASGKVLLPVAFAFAGPAGAEPDDLAACAYGRLENSPLRPSFPLNPIAAILPIAKLASAAAGLGHVNLAYDRDGAPRYDYLALPYAGDFFPSLAVVAAARFLGVPWREVGLALGRGVDIGPVAVPTDRAMRLLINYRGPRGTFPTFSFADLVAGKVPAGALKDRIVLVGASFIGNSDANAQPFGSAEMPGIERMANIIDTILQRDFIAETPPPWPVVVVAAVLVLAAATAGAMAWLPTAAAILAGIAAVAAWFAAAQAAFVHGLWLPLVAPEAALAVAVVAVLLLRYWVVDRDGRMIKAAFRHYLAPDLVNALAAHPEHLKLGGETRRMTMMFCDVRGFTAISEQFKADPAGLTALINRFLTPMTDIIMARRGTIDKYMGDCIMAFWNAPLGDAEHTDHACASALAMIGALDRLNAALAAEAERERRAFHELHVGIGINTGECVVGNMGSDQRFDYSVLGDAVNLASRLEGQSKTYGVAIIIGETTRQAAPAWAALELDVIAVKGKREGVRIFALMGDAETARLPSFAALGQRHGALLAAYRAQDWARAREALGPCRSGDARLGPLYDLYAERIDYFSANPPGPDWDGVFRATSK